MDTSETSSSLDCTADTTVPLLVDTTVLMLQEEEKDTKLTLKRTELDNSLGRNVSIIGALVGVLCVISDVGAHALLLLPGTRIQLVLHSNVGSVLFAMTWTVVFTGIVLYFLNLVLNIVTISYSLNRPVCFGDGEFHTGLEAKFLNGALLGALATWALIDASFGSKNGMFFRIGVLVMIVAVFRLVSCTRCATDNARKIDKTEALQIV